MSQPTFYRSIVDSPEWQAWVRHNELRPVYDVHEAMETGWLSKEHFEAFVAYCAKQYATSMILRYRAHLRLTQPQFDSLVSKFEV